MNPITAIEMGDGAGQNLEFTKLSIYKKYVSSSSSQYSTFQCALSHNDAFILYFSSYEGNPYHFDSLSNLMHRGGSKVSNHASTDALLLNIPSSSSLFIFTKQNV